MTPRTPIDELGLRSEEQEIVDRIFGAGKAHPWSDELVDQIMDWMDGVALSYLKNKRDVTALGSVIPQFKAFLDRIVLERFETLRSADRVVHEHPPYYTADRWPASEFSVIRTVVRWAFEDSPASFTGLPNATVDRADLGTPTHPNRPTP